MTAERKLASQPFTIGSNRFSNLEVTPVFDAYWQFAAERQEIYFRRIEGRLGPWTDDPILKQFRFTNAYRAADRVSQYLIRSVIYEPTLDQNPDEVFFRTILFKIFNKIATWEVLTEQLGALAWNAFRPAAIDSVLSKAQQNGGRIYSAAYIMPPVKLGPPDGVKHRGHLALLELMMRERVYERIQETQSLKQVYEILTTFPSIGPFLGYQLTIDLNYSPLIHHKESDFVVAGPGALDGISKCFVNADNLQPADIIEFMTDRQELEFERLGLNFKSLFGRRLQLIDCQNLFCEISKYSRVAHPDIHGRAGRTRIKQGFRDHGDAPQPFFPPKWNLTVPTSFILTR